MVTFWSDLVTSDPTVTVIVTDSDRNGTILATGGQALLSSRKPGDRIQSLEGRFVTAGFWDSHIHLVDYGISFARIQFDPHDNMGVVLEKVRNQAAHQPRDGWLVGQGWNLQSLGAVPTLTALDAAAGEHPALLLSLDHHTAWINQRGLDRLHLHDQAVGSSTPGILREGVAFRAHERVVAETVGDRTRALRQAVEALHRCGVVGVTSIEEPPGFEALQEVAPTLRVQIFMREAVGEGLLAAGFQAGFGDDFLRLLGVKLFADGALGSHTAWMQEPYEGSSDNRGISAIDPAQLASWARRLAAGRLLAAVHAIGDRAVHEAVQALCGADWKGGAMSRIEHAQLLDDADLQTLKEGGVALSMQPVHLLFDRDIADEHWGPRSQCAFRFRDILQAGIPLIFGSDAPVATPDPVVGLWAAVHRAARGDSPWFSAQCLTPDEAIWCYTRGPAIVDNRPAGVIAPGYWGDFTVWKEDPRQALMEHEPERLAVVGTIIGGRAIF
jgi:predicted amidohydrolase YtcJ